MSNHNAQQVREFLHGVLMAHAENNPEDAELVDAAADDLGMGERSFSYFEISDRADMHTVGTPFGRVTISIGEGDYLVADISPDNGAARVFIDGAECFDPEHGYV